MNRSGKLLSSPFRKLLRVDERPGRSAPGFASLTLEDILAAVGEVGQGRRFLHSLQIDSGLLA